MLPPLAEVLVVVIANGAVAWLLTYLAHSTLLVAVASVADRWRPTPADRAMIWRTALLAPPFTAGAHVLSGGVLSPLSVEPRAVSAALGASTGASLAIAATLASLPVLLPLLAIAGWVAMRSAVGRRTPAGADQQVLLAEVVAAAGHVPGRLTVSARLLTPAAIGVSEICLPATRFDLLSSDERRALLAHELAHLQRRDPLWLGAAGAVAGLLCFQPLNRHALRRLRDASEQAADDAAVRTTHDPGALARALASLATMLVALFGGASAAGSPIVARIERLLGAAPGDLRPSRRRWRGRLAVAVLLALPLLGPGVSVSPERAANAIAWLTPSREEPNARMLEVRRFERAWRDRERSLPHKMRDWLRGQLRHR